MTNYNFLTILKLQLSDREYAEAKGKIDEYLSHEKNRQLFQRFIAKQINPDFENKDGIIKIVSGRVGCGCGHPGFTLIIDEHEAKIEVFGEEEAI